MNFTIKVFIVPCAKYQLVILGGTEPGLPTGIVTGGKYHRGLHLDHPSLYSTLVTINLGYALVFAPWSPNLAMKGCRSLHGGKTKDWSLM